MKTPKLFSTDYVIYNSEKNDLVRYHFHNEIVIYGSKEEAIKDCIDPKNEQVISCNDLSEEFKLLIINELGNENL